MKFICLICAEQVMEQLEPEDARAHFEEYRLFTERIQRAGQLVECNRLLPSATATTIRVRNGRTLVTDGPFAETKEQFGGYYVIEAADLDQAIGIAAGIPGASRGCVEIRAIAEDAQTRRTLAARER